MAADVGDLPDRGGVRGRQVGGERAAQQGAAAVPLAVGAYEHERVADVRAPVVRAAQPALVAGPERREVQFRQVRGVGDLGRTHPGEARQGVGHEDPSGGRFPAVRAAGGAADQCYAHPVGLGGPLQSAAEGRFQAAGGEGLGAPGAGLFDQQPGPGGGGGAGQRLGQVTGSGRARAHVGKPNLICRAGLTTWPGSRGAWGRGARGTGTVAWGTGGVCGSRVGS